jgi:putative effector of murein hydrolase LrgA (UPF0299 family)
MRSIWKTASIWGLVGVGVAVLFMLGASLLGLLHPSPALDGLRQDIELFVWPTSFWLMATEGAGRTTTVEIVVTAVLANFVVYFVVGLVLTAAWRALKRLTAKPSPANGNRKSTI